MAMNKKIEAVSNFMDKVIFENAYLKIDSLTGDKNSMVISLQCLKEKNSSLIKVETYVFTPDLEGENFIKQAYDYLKTLPEYLDATDC